MQRFLLFTLLTISLTLPALSQTAIDYDVSWDDPSTHYFHISMKVGNIDGETLDVDMPAWRPGRYIMQDYAKYVIDVEAHSPSGEDLGIVKTDLDSWQVSTAGNKEVVVSYKTYANKLDAGESFLDENEAYLNPISILMNVPGRMTEPVSLKLKNPEGWKVATALDLDENTGAYHAEDYHELVDSPFLSSADFDLLSFDFEGTPIEIAIQGDWDYDPDQVIADHYAITKAQKEIMGFIPFPKFLFMYHIIPNAFGHAVEHKNSTSLVMGPSSAINMPAEGETPQGRYFGMLNTASHELFHVWNVERIRPAVMYPPDYSREQYTSQMWIFEGITTYYSGIAMIRGGLQSEVGFLNGIANTINSFDNNPGRKVTSIAMSSWDSWAKQGKAPPQTYYSFYTAGKAVGVVLDMDIRRHTENKKSLDDVFRYLYAEYPMKDRGVPEDGFQKALEVVAEKSYQDFFDKYINGTEDLDWNSYLSAAGLSLLQREDENPISWMRALVNDDNSFVRVVPRGPAFNAGFKDGDVIKSVNDQSTDDGDSLKKIMSGFSVGEQVSVVVERGETEQTIMLEIGRPVIRASMQLLEESSPLQDSIRDSWLGK